MSNNIDGGKLSIIGAYENGPRSAVDGRKITRAKTSNTENDLYL